MPMFAPRVSPATGLENQYYSWKHGQQIRFQVSGPVDGEPVLLVHGLFCNSDHWRKSLAALADKGYRAYAMDLFGCGYSDKPLAGTPVAQACNGEHARFSSSTTTTRNTKNGDLSPIVRNVKLSRANGKDMRRVDVDLRHPLKSPYNFYTWSDQLNDFCQDVILPNTYSNKNTEETKVALVGNSMGTVAALQAAMDAPELYKGVFCVVPTFRELHSAEMGRFAMPFFKGVQSLLQRYGHTAFDALAKPETVKDILMEPYAQTDQVDDALVKALLDPLLTPGAAEVVLDKLSYSAGPLPEQQLSSPNFPAQVPVWMGYGQQDPWTPGARVEALARYSAVQRIMKWKDAGHAPHDEVPDQVHADMLAFLKEPVPVQAAAAAATDKAERETVHGAEKRRFSSKPLFA